jgi:hypothetical protein
VAAEFSIPIFLQLFFYLRLKLCSYLLEADGFQLHLGVVQEGLKSEIQALLE